jgi:hypothetical protein
MKQSRHSVYGKTKKKMGRPATGQDPPITTRLPIELRAKVEEWAATNDCPRSQAIRRLVELGLASANQLDAPTRAEGLRRLAAQALTDMPKRKGK